MNPGSANETSLGPTMSSRFGGVSQAAAVTRILRSTAMMGAASVLSMAAAVVRTKLIALLLGPAGIGIYGALQAIQGFATTVADMGLSGAGAREIAAAAGRGESVEPVQSQLFRLSLVLGTTMGGLLWLFRHPVSVLAFEHDGYASAIGILGIGVCLAAVGGATTAMLTGTHRVKAVAEARIMGSLGALCLGAAAIYWLRADGLAWALVSIPAATLACTWAFARPRLRIEGGIDGLWSGPTASRLLHYGGSTVLAAAAGTAMQVGTRAFMIRTLGITAAGEYQAAWVLSVLYTGIVLAAVPADYVPRASALSGNRAALSAEATLQLKTALGVLAPVVFLASLFAPWAVTTLYSSEFSATAAILRWHTVGDCLRVVWWILSATLAIDGKLRRFVFAEVFWNVCYFASVVLLTSHFGLAGAGPAYVLAQVICLPVLIWLTRGVVHATLWVGVTPLLLSIAVPALLVLVNEQAEVAPFYVSVLLAGAGLSLVIGRLGKARWTPSSETPR